MRPTLAQRPRGRAVVISAEKEPSGNAKKDRGARQAGQTAAHPASEAWSVSPGGARSLHPGRTPPDFWLLLAYLDRIPLVRGGRLHHRVLDTDRGQIVCGAVFRRCLLLLLLWEPVAGPQDLPAAAGRPGGGGRRGARSGRASPLAGILDADRLDSGGHSHRHHLQRELGVGAGLSQPGRLRVRRSPL